MYIEVVIYAQEETSRSENGSAIKQPVQQRLSKEAVSKMPERTFLHFIMQLIPYGLKLLHPLSTDTLKNGFFDNANDGQEDEALNKSEEMNLLHNQMVHIND